MKAFQNAVVVVLLALPLAARADDKKLIEKRPADRAPTTEMEFVVKAIAGNIAEIKLSETAIKQSSDKDVEAFARRMVKDHTNLRDALLERAKVMKVAVVAGLEKDTQEKVDRLSRLSGKDFDREYMKCMVDDHEKTLDLFQTWAKKASDTELRDLLNRSIPTVKEHLERARQLSSKLKA
jgi:putative membrane protein